MTKAHLKDIESVFLGLAIGDALGVPVEFRSREVLRRSPVTGMTGHGSHNQPPGTFSDDSSLAFCLAEALIDGFDPERVGRLIVRWYREGYWTARGQAFDIGHTTQIAINRLEEGVPAEQAGPDREASNGNGSLMRIAPLLFSIADLPVEARFTRTRSVASVTHGHIRSVAACFLWLEFARRLLSGLPKEEAYRTWQADVPDYLHHFVGDPAEVRLFSRFMSGSLADQPEGSIQSSGYVMHTLEASLWCLMTTSSYPEAVLRAVNLGEDTDTTAAVAGALAGLLYGREQIPAEWISALARHEDILDLAARFHLALQAGHAGESS